MKIEIDRVYGLGDLDPDALAMAREVFVLSETFGDEMHPVDRVVLGYMQTVTHPEIFARDRTGADSPEVSA